MATPVSSTVVSTIASAVSSATSAARTGSGAHSQAGILEGANPLVWSASNPIGLFIIQAIIVIVVCQLLSYPLRWLAQPRVIAEVIGGIILGPSVMMRIPNFRETIFPTSSMPVFNNVANLGLVIFLFLVALEVDIRLFTHNWRVALSVGLAGMILPFGLGFGIAHALYSEYGSNEGTIPISFGVFGLFVGTALAITAFPVLCRILTELKLLRSNVGVTVLAAGIGNDVTGWVLLALCVALVNNGSGLAALYALLCAIGWTLFLIFAVRPPFMWILRRTGSLQNGPTQGMVALTLLMVLASAFFTNIIGIHAIFGAFLVGMICPHDGGFAIEMTEKIEDLISVLFLPLYFALSGLNTNLGLLNDGTAWAYVIGVTFCAFAGKIMGGTLAAKLNKLRWRESITVGCLMSCKGLVELIVLNIGLEARILTQKTFTIFVVMALVTTVSTTPLTKAFYPSWYQEKVARWRKGEIDWDDNPLESSPSALRLRAEMSLDESPIQRLSVYLRLDSLPSLFTFISLLGNNEDASKDKEATDVRTKKRPLEVYGHRILELTERTSSVMHVTEGEQFYTLRDPVLNAFRTFSQLHDIAVSGCASVVPQDSYAETLMMQTADVLADFALIPWGEYGGVTEDCSVPSSFSTGERFRSSAQLQFIQDTLQKASAICNSGILIDNGFGSINKPADRLHLARSGSAVSLCSHSDTGTALSVINKNHHILLPFVGGADDRVALRVVLQLANNQHVRVTICHVRISDEDSDVSGGFETSTAKVPIGDTSDSCTNSPIPEQPIKAGDLAVLAAFEKALPERLTGRVKFTECTSTSTSILADTLRLVQNTVGQTNNAGDAVVVGRRHLQLDDSTETGGQDLRRTVGVVADYLVVSGLKASLLVVQAGGRGLNI